MNYIDVSFTLRGKTATINEPFELAGIIVPEGFQSDGISSPRITWLWWAPFSKYCPAAFVHDWCIKKYGYAYARDKFEQALKELEASDREVFLLYNAVRSKDWVYRQLKIKPQGK